jgi:hypothetical protein
VFAFRFDRILAQGLEHFGSNPVGADAESLKNAGGHAVAFAQEAEHKVLGANVVMAEAAGLVHCEFENAFGPLRESALARFALVTTADYQLDRGAYLVRIGAHGHEYLGRDAVALPGQTDQDVFSANVAVSQAMGFLLREAQSPAGAAREAFETV